MSLEATIVRIAKAARAASVQMARCAQEKKNQALLNIAKLLEAGSLRIQEENQKDLERAREMGLSAAMIDRLTVNPKTLASMTEGLRDVVGLEDPVGAIARTWRRPNGLQVSRMRIPLGVIGIIYESRPNVTVDAAALCLKAGNAVILRGGSEAFLSNRILSDIISQGLSRAGLPAEAVQLVPVREREAVNILLRQEEDVDLIIPRGGEGLIRFVVKTPEYRF